jgi:hypothetical protein
MHNAPPLCPTCLQPASKSLAGPEHSWECRNEACPEYGQPALLDSDHGTQVLDEIQDDPSGT